MAVALQSSVAEAAAEMGEAHSFRAVLLPCNNSRPAGQWLTYHHNSDGTLIYEFMGQDYQPLPKRAALGVTTVGALADSGDAEAAATLAADPLSATQLLLMAVPYPGDPTRSSWSFEQPLSGGGSVYRPVLNASQCMWTTTVPGSTVRVSQCMPMPPPQPNGYPMFTATFYYGPGGVSADSSLAMTNPGSGGVPTPALCIVVPGLSPTNIA